MKCISNPISTINQENEDPSSKITYDKLLSKLGSKQSSIVASSYNSTHITPGIPSSEKKLNAIEYKMIFQQYIDKEISAEREF